MSVTWLALCSQYFFSYLMIAPLENKFPPIKAQSTSWQSANAIWVLACYHFDAELLPSVSQVNDCSLERLTHAANMYRIKRVPIYLTGGSFNSSTSKSHADVAASLLIALGVDKTDIKHVATGGNTIQEAFALSKQIGAQKLAVVSSATHGLRVSKILNQLKIDFVFVPVHFATQGEITFKVNAPSLQSLVRAERAMYEYGALLKYWLKN